MSQFQPPEPEPYAKYKLRHYGYNNGLDRGKLSATPSYDYEDVKVKPVLQTTVTFGEGLKSPAELFGSFFVIASFWHETNLFDVTHSKVQHTDQFAFREQ